jgi:hypothetical protein
MQAKRHNADYDPYIKLTKSEVEQDLAIVCAAIDAFAREPVKDRRAFCAFVMLKRRPT